jgi:hypothetical protein
MRPRERGTWVVLDIGILHAVVLGAGKVSVVLGRGVG